MDPRGGLELLRPGNALMTAVAVPVGAVAVAGTSALGHVTPVAWGALAGFAFTGAGNALNDVLDRDLDKAAHPERPIPSGRVTPRGAAILSAVLFLVALAAGALVGLWGAALVLVALVLMLAYEFALKRRGLAGNLVIGALTGAPFLLGALATDVVSVVAWTLAGLAALATLGREILKDVEDVDADVGRSTLPQRVGTQAASQAAAAAMMVAVVLSPLPGILPGALGASYLGLVALADAGFLWSAWRGLHDAARGQRLAKASMLVALVAFVAGRLAGEVWL